MAAAKVPHHPRLVREARAAGQLFDTEFWTLLSAAQHVYQTARIAYANALKQELEQEQ